MRSETGIFFTSHWLFCATEQKPEVEFRRVGCCRGGVKDGVGCGARYECLDEGVVQGLG